MIKLINGRGQLGSVLKGLVKKSTAGNIDAFIYHTWNFSDKSEEVQKRCHRKFIDFVDQNQKTKIVFTSTYSQTENPYNYYKQLSEVYLLDNHKRGYVIRLPILIGKGVCEQFREDELEPFGKMELMSLENAAKEVLKVTNTNSKIKSIRATGDIVPARLVKDLILFGKYGKIL